ncbi:MAG: c-type cytochrome [Elusimicrobia bacterium]|nr:c-type cytochrome [Elusimicrobiota bacterium]
MSWRQDYLKQYKELKEKGRSFFPYAVVKDICVAALILAALCFLALKLGAPLEDLADPTDSTYNPRPEWYFLFIFQALKFFPGKLEAVAAVILPGAAAGVLLFLPFLDRSPERHPLNRPFWLSLGLAALTGMGLLTYYGAKSPMLNPVIEKDPAVMAGTRLYRALNCAYCHRIGGKGGEIGPELDKVVGEETEDWLVKHLRDPKAANPGSEMPKLNLLDDEIQALVVYMKSLAGGPFTGEAPKLFADNCAACHRIGGEGGDGGPDLSLIGSARDKIYIKKYILDPTQLNQSSTMPGFKGQLADTQIEDLARYIAAQKFNGPPAAAAAEKDPLVLAGRRLYRNLNCAYCHKLNARGGVVGPELDKVTGKKAEDWLTKHFRDPQAVSPGSSMPKLDLRDDEIRALVAYMKSLEKR